jgi:hypothetical protein
LEPVAASGGGGALAVLAEPNELVSFSANTAMPNRLCDAYNF